MTIVLFGFVAGLLTMTIVNLYKHVLIIMNEGKLPPEVPVEKLKTDHLSRPRNTVLAEIFYFAGLIEAWGRGTLKIVEQCIAHELPEPDFTEEHGVMNVFFYKDKWTEENLRKLDLSGRQIKGNNESGGQLVAENIENLQNCRMRVQE